MKALQRFAWIRNLPSFLENKTLAIIPSLDNKGIKVIDYNSVVMNDPETHANLERA
jgi:hypothetical protein